MDFLKRKKYFTMVLQDDLHDCWGELTTVNITEKSQAVGYQLLSEMDDVTSVSKYYRLQCFPIALLILRNLFTLLVNGSLFVAIWRGNRDLFHHILSSWRMTRRRKGGWRMMRVVNLTQQLPACFTI